MGTWYQARYCLTQGIKEITDGTYSASRQYISHGSPGHHQFDRIGVNIFETIDDARLDQSERRQRLRQLIASAEKKIARLKELL